MKKKNIFIAAVGGVLAVVAGIFFLKKRKQEPTPPPDAPQLDLGNRTDQSEFTPLPTGDPDLG